MAISRRQALAYAEELLSTPKGRIPVTLRRTKSGVVLEHQGRPLTRCYPTSVGAAQAAYLGIALGLERIPDVGESVTVEVSTGLLLRAVNVTTLDPRKPAHRALLERYLEEAELQRTWMGVEAAEM